jgi:predicted small lipoprotein YifL
MNRYWGVFLLFIFLSACGRKGSLVRPEALVPARISDFQVMQRGDSLQLTWSSPKKLESGSKLSDLAGFRLLVREISPEGGGCPDCPDSWKLLSKLDLEFLKNAIRVGDSFVYSDVEARHDVTYGYRLISFTKSNAESSPAEAKFTKLPPLPAPVLKATSTNTSVTLECSFGALPEGYVSDGCVVYRFRPGDQVPTLPLVNIKNSSAFEDITLEHGVKYIYLAAVLAKTDGQTIEGNSSSVSIGTTNTD